MTKLVVGNKYVPLKKTVGVSLEKCTAWNRAQEEGQNFLYYNGKGILSKKDVFNWVKSEGVGDHFSPEDVVPYVEEKDLIIGNKYIPIKKTVKDFENLESSAMWRKAQEKGQGFLYYNGVSRTTGYHLFDVEKGELGDFFNANDVVPYVEPVKEEKKVKLIVGNKYVPIKKTIYGSLDSSTVWNVAQEKGQGFLYYNGCYDCEAYGRVHLFDYEKGFNGDYFNADDVIPYEEPVEEEKKTKLVVGEKYTPIKKTTGVRFGKNSPWMLENCYYYLGQDAETGQHMFGLNKDSKAGIFFNEDDVVPYVEKLEAIDHIVVKYV